MDAVIDNYFEDAHRGLQTNKKKGGPGGAGGGGSGGGGSSSSSAPAPGALALPPVAGSTGRATVQGDSFDLAMSGRFQIQKEKVIASLLEEKYEDVLKDNEKLARKLRNAQDQISIIGAKKQAYKQQSEKIQEELEKMNKAFEAVQADAARIQEENEYWAGASKEAVTMMNEMRHNHITEVRLLQRGLQSRNDESTKNRVNEMADLLDKLGKAIVQRDEAVKEKTK